MWVLLGEPNMGPLLSRRVMCPAIVHARSVSLAANGPVLLGVLALAMVASPCPAAEQRFFLEVEAESAEIAKPPLVVREGRGTSGGMMLYADPVLWHRAERFVAFGVDPMRGEQRMGGLGLAQYAVELPRDGAYCTWFCCWFLNSGDDSFYFRVDDGTWHRVSEWKYFDWRWIRGPVLTLKG